MADYSITLTLPEGLYTQLEAQAQTETRSIHDLVVETLVRHTAPPIASDLPLELQAELKAMAALSASALWTIAESTMNPDKVALYDLLLERQQDGALTIEGRDLLEQLREEADFLMVRKAHAYALLKSKGHKLPTLHELRTV